MTTATTKEPTSVDLLLNLYDVQITSEHEALFQQLQEWVATFAALDKQIADGQKTLEYSRRQAPRQPVEIEDIREWVIFQTRRDRHQKGISDQEKEITKLVESQWKIADCLIGSLPYRVWFKINNLAVGIECDEDEPEVAPVVVVKPWGTHTSYRLDRRGLKV